MLIVFSLALLMLFLKWIARRCYCPVPDRYKRDASKLQDSEAEKKDLKEGTERLRHKRMEEEELKKKPKDFFDEVDEMIAAKKKIQPPSRPRSKYEGVLFLNEWNDYERKVSNACQIGQHKNGLDKADIEEMKENIRKCKY